MNFWKFSSLQNKGEVETKNGKEYFRKEIYAKKN
jgi:hypothetical protein